MKREHQIQLSQKQIQLSQNDKNIKKNEAAPPFFWGGARGPGPPELNGDVSTNGMYSSKVYVWQVSVLAPRRRRNDKNTNKHKKQRKRNIM